jgi:hypothetical protein
VTENELARGDRRPVIFADRRAVAAIFRRAAARNLRLPEPVSKAEVLRVPREHRRVLAVRHRHRPGNLRQLRAQLRKLRLNVRSRVSIYGEEDVGLLRAAAELPTRRIGIMEPLPAGSHALAEFLREGVERCLWRQSRPKHATRNRHLASCPGFSPDTKALR